MSMLESYLTAEEQVPFYDCSDFPFNFAFIEMYAPITASKVAKDLNDWLNFLPEGKTANWVVSIIIVMIMINVGDNDAYHLWAINWTFLIIADPPAFKLQSSSIVSYCWGHCCPKDSSFCKNVKTMLKDLNEIWALIMQNSILNSIKCDKKIPGQLIFLEWRIFMDVQITILSGN